MGFKKFFAIFLLLITNRFCLAQSDFQKGAKSSHSDMTKIVKGEYHHGIPYDTAMKITKADTLALLNILKNPKEEQHWGNVIFLIGLCGDNRALSSLINFLERDIKGDLEKDYTTTDLFSTLISTLPAIGHLASNGNNKAIAYLVTASSPTYWRTTRLPWRSRYANSDTLPFHLAKAAILGLGISAQPRAIERLQHIQQITTSSEENDALKIAASDALLLATEIEKKGRSEVFGITGETKIINK